MLFLVFSVGPARYALPVDRIVEVVPLVEMQPIPQAPAPVLGLMSYRGSVVPVIDLRQQFLGEPSEQSLSTRIMVVWPHEVGGLMVGLVGEKATETQRFDEAEFQDQALQLPHALQLGPVRVFKQEMIQRIRLDQLLTEEMRRLFQAHCPREAST